MSSEEWLAANWICRLDSVFRHSSSFAFIRNIQNRPDNPNPLTIVNRQSAPPVAVGTMIVMIE
jgi:hypothetical protein